MRPAAIYARYSSDAQRPSSIDDQVALCRAHAARTGLAVVDVFSDAAVSGFGAVRSGYDRLVEEATSRRFEVILVEDLSRLTRDTAELLRLCQRLRLAGVEVIGVSDGIATSAKGATVHVTVKGLVNQLYLEDLREKTHRGLAAAFERGLSTGGRTYGYRTVRLEELRVGKHSAPASIEIDPAEAAIVRRIFEEYSSGRSLRTITAALNADGIPFPAAGTARGPARRGWAVESVGFILRNERYAGRITWNRLLYLKNPDTKRRIPIRRPPCEWKTKEVPELRIVDPRLWDAVQARRRRLAGQAAEGTVGRAATGAARAAYSSRYLLAGLLRCGVCSARMVGITQTRRKRGKAFRYGWYYCGFALRKGTTVCDHVTRYRQADLEGLLVDRLRAAVGDEELLSQLVAMANAELEQDAGTEHSRAANDAAELARLRREAQNLIAFIAAGDSSTAREELRRREVRIAELEARHARPAVLPQIRLPWVKARIARIVELLQDDVQQAKAEFAKHLDGDLRITPEPGPVEEVRATLSGALKAESLLAGDQEARLYRSVHCGGRI